MRKEKKLKDEPAVSRERVNWPELVGFGQDKSLLKKLVEEQGLPTVVLFEGREGIGKRYLLYYLAALHFCKQGTACGVCVACQKVIYDQHPDLLTIQGEGENLKVSSIRDVGEFIAYAPESDAPFAKRVVLLIDAERLTSAAVNKLLKTLEEPSPHSRIFISTAHLKQLLPTLLSRCVRWHLKSPSREDVLLLLKTKFPQAVLPPEHSVCLLRYGNAPGPILRRLDQKREEEDLAQNLLRCRKVGDILSFAERFKQESNCSLSDFLSEFEFALNQVYREAIEKKDGSLTGNLRERRKFLSELKRLVMVQKIALNPQMVLEKLAFFNLQIPVRHDERT